MNLNKQPKEKIEDYFTRIHLEGYIPKECYQGITIEKVTTFLKAIDKYSDVMRDVILCLSNNELPNLYSKTSTSHTFSSGASVAHIGSYIGILFRHNKKLDREGRDYWIKPLIDINVIEPITLQNYSFIQGHIKAKSPNSCYRLNKNFISFLNEMNQYNFENEIKKWLKFSQTSKQRLNVVVQKNMLTSDNTSHKSLIIASITLYARYYLPDYICIFTDSDDGNRITDNERALLSKYNIKFGSLSDVWPDAILFNEKTNSLWFIEAVTSDGEIDSHKFNGFRQICINSKKNFGGCTTTYFTLKRFYERQHANNNLACNSYVWIKELPNRQFFIC